METIQHYYHACVCGFLLCPGYHMSIIKINLIYLVCASLINVSLLTVIIIFSQEEFIDELARALIAMHENKVYHELMHTKSQNASTLT